MAGHLLYLDHYLYKTAVRHLTTIRAWRQIDELARTHQKTQIEINILETGDVARDRWYPGATEDMAAHLFALLAHTKIGLENEEGKSLQPGETAARRQNFFEALCTEPGDQDIVLGRYRGFPDSAATYFAARVRLTHSDWVNVPIIIRSGKSLSADVATVRIWFENRQLIEARVQPDPVLRLVSIARNGAGARYVDENLVIDPTEPGPYGRVLVELQRGERSWFLTERESRTVRAWLSAAGRCRPPLLPYDPGSIGPNSGPLDFSR